MHKTRGLQHPCSEVLLFGTTEELFLSGVTVFSTQSASNNQFLLLPSYTVKKNEPFGPLAVDRVVDAAHWLEGRKWCGASTLHMSPLWSTESVEPSAFRLPFESIQTRKISGSFLFFITCGPCSCRWRLSDPLWFSLSVITKYQLCDPVSVYSCGRIISFYQRKCFEFH